MAHPHGIKSPKSCFPCEERAEKLQQFCGRQLGIHPCSLCQLSSSSSSKQLPSKSKTHSKHSFHEGGVKSIQTTAVTLSTSMCLTVHLHCLCLHTTVTSSFQPLPYPLEKANLLHSGCWKSTINAVKSFKRSLAWF